MKCPACNNNLMSFFNFYLWSHPFTTKCKECRTKLQPDSRIKKVLYMEIFVTIILAGLIQSTIGLGSKVGLVIFILVSALILYPFEKYSWENGSYKMKM